MQTEIFARQILRIFGAGPCLVLGAYSAQLVSALLAHGVDARNHTISDVISETNSALMPGRFTVGPLEESPETLSRIATVVLVNFLDDLSIAQVRKVLAQCHSLAQNGIMLLADQSASPLSRTSELRSRVWWEDHCIEAGFRRHPRGLQLRESQQLGVRGNDVIIVCESIPEVALGRDLLLDSAGCKRQADVSRESGAFADAHTARYAWATRWIKPGDTVVDANCGTGSGSWILSKLSRAGKVIGINSSKTSVEYARIFFSCPQVEFTAGDLMQTLEGLPADSIDCIIGFEVLERFQNAGELLESFKRVLVPAGRVIIGLEAKYRDRADDDPKQHGRSYAWDELKSLLAACYLVDYAAIQIIDRAKTVASWVKQSVGIIAFDPSVNSLEVTGEWLLAVGIKPFLYKSLPSFPHRFAIDGVQIHINSNDFPAMLENPWLQRGLLDASTRPVCPAVLRGICDTLIADASPKNQAAALTILGYRLAEDGSVTSKQLSQHVDLITIWFERHLLRAAEAQITRWLVSLSFLSGILTLRMGNLEASAVWFERCVEVDAAVFGPLLFTKTVEAAHRLGWIRYGQGKRLEAQRAWTLGMAEASRALALQHDAGANPLANRLAFVFDEYGAICDMATRCAVANNQLSTDNETLSLGPVLSRPRERRVELEARVSFLNQELAEAKAALSQEFIPSMPNKQSNKKRVNAVMTRIGVLFTRLLRQG